MGQRVGNGADVMLPMAVRTAAHIGAPLLHQLPVGGLGVGLALGVAVAALHLLQAGLVVRLRVGVAGHAAFLAVNGSLEGVLIDVKMPRGAVGHLGAEIDVAVAEKAVGIFDGPGRRGQKRGQGKGRSQQPKKA